MTSWHCDVFCGGSTLATQWVDLLKHFFLGKLLNSTLPVTVSMVRGLGGCQNSGSKFPRYALEFEFFRNCGSFERHPDGRAGRRWHSFFPLGRADYAHRGRMWVDGLMIG